MHILALGMVIQGVTDRALICCYVQPQWKIPVCVFVYVYVRVCMGTCAKGAL